MKYNHVAPVCLQRPRNPQFVPRVGRTQGNPAIPPGIEGVKMGRVYYNPMRNLAAALLLVAGVFLGGSISAQQQQTSLKTASLESHEGMTITAQPLTDAASYKEKFPKKSPLSAGVVAIQVAFRNDSDESLKVDVDRIKLNVQLSEDDRRGLDSLSPEDVANIVLSSKRKDPTRRPRIPLPSSGVPSKDKNWAATQQAARSAAVPGTIVAPHKTMQGLLYFDLEGQLDLLNSAHLYVPNVTSLEKNHELMFFEIDLSRPASR
jgi:hypothetical protein